jgi:hypothetical protein
MLSTTYGNANGATDGTPAIAVPPQGTVPAQTTPSQTTPEHLRRVSRWPWGHRRLAVFLGKETISMRPTYRILMLSTVLLGTSLAIAQAQTSASPNNMTPPSSMQPIGAYSSVQLLLTAANQAIAAGQTGLATERLNQAKTKIVNRWVHPTNGPQTYQSIDPVVQQINNARFALTKNDTVGAQQIIDKILASNAPELSD